MSKFFILTFSLFLATAAFAQNPQIRICRVTEGEFQAVDIPGDQIGLCHYQNSFIDAVSILTVTSGENQSLAIQALFGSNTDSCEAAGAQTVAGQDLEGNQFQLCLFQDQSLIELNTLITTATGASNAGLVKAIQTRF